MMDYTIFGESHGPAVGVLLRDVPPGLPVDEEFICRQLLRRAPQDPLSTARHEPDQVEVLSGVYQGVTTGMPVCLLLRNRDVRSADYDALRHTPRPSHADYTAWVQSDGRNDPRGGGAFSGRLTAPLVAAGALAKSCLKLQDIKVNAQVIDGIVRPGLHGGGRPESAGLHAHAQRGRRVNRKEHPSCLICRNTKSGWHPLP